MIHTILRKTTLKRYKIVWFLGSKRVTQDLHKIFILYYSVV